MRIWKRRGPIRRFRSAFRKDDQSLIIGIQDQGPGISPEELARIFDEFYTTKPTGEGTGLGLSIARDIVAKYLKGTISVESVRGEGSLFIIRLPRANPLQRASVAP